MAKKKIKNKVEHNCYTTDCDGRVVLEWDSREFKCKCGTIYRYNPTVEPLVKVRRTKGTDWLKNSRLRKSRNG